MFFITGLNFDISLLMKEESRVLKIKLRASFWQNENIEQSPENVFFFSLFKAMYIN